MNYEAALQSIPAPGAGCHPALLGVANLGAKAGLDPNQIVADIRSAIPSGKRRVGDREIQDAVAKALREKGEGWNGERRGSGLSRATRQDHARRQRAEKAAREQAKRTIDAIPRANPVELWERSPVRLTNDPREDAQLLLRGLFNSDERVWVGDTFEKHEPAKPGNWCERLGGRRVPTPVYHPKSANRRAGRNEIRRIVLSVRCGNSGSSVCAGGVRRLDDQRAGGTCTLAAG